MASACARAAPPSTFFIPRLQVDLVILVVPTILTHQ
jgi:hypothetical protein